MSEEEPSGLDPDAAIRRIDAGGTPSGPDPTVAPDADADADAGPGLDPGADVGERQRGDRPPRPPAPVIDTLRYQRMIGGFGLLVVVAFSLFLFLRGGSGTPGIVAGQRLHRFVAPLATSNLNATANGHPVCNRARPSPRGLNVCGRRPIVLAFFTLGRRQCVQQVDTLQAVSADFPHVQFAAVAIDANRTATAKLVAQHHWTIPVAYDSTDTVGQIYGVEVCPLAEIGTARDRVAAELIGRYWVSADHLAAEVRKLGLAR